MKLEEARLIDKLHDVPKPLRRDAQRVIRLAEAMDRNQRREADLHGLPRVHMDRINAILAYRLALACGKFDDWRQAA